MARMPLKSLQETADEVLREVDNDAMVKRAEQEIVRTVSRQPKTELGQLLHKVAEVVRASDDSEITYGELNEFIAKGGRR